jgi:hypothetical protein
MNKRFMAVLLVMLVLTVSVFAAETLVYEANFNKTDKKDVFWEPVNGEWETDGEHMVNFDTNDGNTNIFQELDQVGDGTWIYEYKVTYDIKGGMWAPAAGMHIMCSEPDAPQRGDSYLIFQDLNEMQLYRCSGGAITAVMQVPGFPAIVGQTVVVRTEYNTLTGNIKVFLNGDLVIDWTDDEPIFDGQFISLRTNQTQASYDYVKVWYKK